MAKLTEPIQVKVNLKDETLIEIREMFRKEVQAALSQTQPFSTAEFDIMRFMRDIKAAKCEKCGWLPLEVFMGLSVITRGFLPQLPICRCSVEIDRYEVERPSPDPSIISKR
jgi:hypothetical protein